MLTYRAAVSSRLFVPSSKNCQLTVTTLRALEPAAFALTLGHPRHSRHRPSNPSTLHTSSSRAHPRTSAMAPTNGVNGASGPASFVGAIDQGTTSSRFLIFDSHGDVVASHQLEFKQIYPQPGWHEHSPAELISSVTACIDAAVTTFKSQGHPAAAIKAVGITNQRETTVVWNARTGEPLHNALVWTDTRAAPLVRRLKHRLGSESLSRICGVPLSTYPSVTKLLWLLENVPSVKDAYDKGELAFGTVDAWLVYKLNGGPARNVFVTDPSNASRTMFMNLETCAYDDQLLDFFRLDTNKLQLPTIVRSSHAHAYGTLASTKLHGTPITGCLGDQSAALVGHKGFAAGRAKNTYGTGCFLLSNCGPSPALSAHGLLTTVAYDFGPAHGGRAYALEGSIAAAGSSVEFLAKNWGFAESAGKVGALAGAVEDSGGVVFVTAFSGLFAPYWCDDARGTLWGITQYTQTGHVARAVLEATCFQTKAILDAMEKDGGAKLTELAVDGGMCKSDLTMQIQADIINIPVHRPAMRETTALGAAIAAGLAAGVWASLDDLRDVNTDGRTVFTPQVRPEKSAAMFARWEKAVEMSKGWL